VIGFLDRADTKSFKLTSFRHGMLCLREMAKISIGVFNLNEMIDDQDGKYVDMLGTFDNLKLSFVRYPANMTISSLCEVWAEKYGILLNSQLVVTESTVSSRYCFPSENQDTSIKFLDKQYIVYDLRNTVLFSPPNNTPKVIGDIGQFDPVQFRKSSGHMLLIKYFDLFFQELVPIQWVLVSPMQLTIERLTQYIENEFIAITTKQREWHKQLMKYFNKMDQIAAHVPKLRVFAENTIASAHRFVECLHPQAANAVGFVQIYAFQLNTFHPYFVRKKYHSLHESGLALCPWT